MESTAFALFIPLRKQEKKLQSGSPTQMELRK
jgi:hypothetical protein